jgi:cobalt transporter subunit CbtA
MIGRLVLAALVAGILAGLVLAGIQSLRLTPLIAQAEVFEHEDGHENTAAAPAEGAQPAKPACVENMPGMKMCNGTAEAWQPGDGAERTFYTTLASVMAGAGFAVMLLGVSLVSGIPITRENGLVWGLCGFLAVSVAPAAGLPPELPGMPVADLMARQVWWLGTIAATAAALYLIATQRRLAPLALGVALLAAPHLIGAPQAPAHESQVPAHLAAAFVANAIAAAAVFWALIGVFLGLFTQRLNQDISAT